MRKNIKELNFYKEKFSHVSDKNKEKQLIEQFYASFQDPKILPLKSRHNPFFLELNQLFQSIHKENRILFIEKVAMIVANQPDNGRFLIQRDVKRFDSFARNFRAFFAAVIESLKSSNVSTLDFLSSNAEKKAFANMYACYRNLVLAHNQDVENWHFPNDDSSDDSFEDALEDDHLQFMTMLLTDSGTDISLLFEYLLDVEKASPRPHAYRNQPTEIIVSLRLHGLCLEYIEQNTNHDLEIKTPQELLNGLDTKKQQKFLSDLYQLSSYQIHDRMPKFPLGVRAISKYSRVRLLDSVKQEPSILKDLLKICYERHYDYQPDPRQPCFGASRIQNGGSMNVSIVRDFEQRSEQEVQQIINVFKLFGLVDQPLLNQAQAIIPDENYHYLILYVLAASLDLLEQCDDTAQYTEQCKDSKLMLMRNLEVTLSLFLLRESWQPPFSKLLQAYYNVADSHEESKIFPNNTRPSCCLNRGMSEELPIFADILPFMGRNDVSSPTRKAIYSFVEKMAARSLEYLIKIEGRSEKVLSIILATMIHGGARLLPEGLSKCKDQLSSLHEIQKFVISRSRHHNSSSENSFNYLHKMVAYFYAYSLGVITQALSSDSPKLELEKIMRIFSDAAEGRFYSRLYKGSDSASQKFANEHFRAVTNILTKTMLLVLLQTKDLVFSSQLQQHLAATGIEAATSEELLAVYNKHQLADEIRQDLSKIRDSFKKIGFKLPETLDQFTAYSRALNRAKQGGTPELSGAVDSGITAWGSPQGSGVMLQELAPQNNEHDDAPDVIDAGNARDEQNPNQAADIEDAPIKRATGSGCTIC